MTLCVFCCSCSQKTNDVKKTSSQHEKKLKSVPNNTKEDVISEEDLEKGYDLPVSAQENEEATRDSMQIMSGLEHIYRNADKGDSLNVVLDNKSICKMIKKIKQQGYSVTVSEDYSNMENYKRFSSFLANSLIPFLQKHRRNRKGRVLFMKFIPRAALEEKNLFMTERRCFYWLQMYRGMIMVSQLLHLFPTQG